MASKTLYRSDLQILRLFDKELYDRDTEMGWIKGYKNQSEEVQNFFAKAKQRKFGNTRIIMNELVVFEDDCLMQYDMPFNDYVNDYNCIRHIPFFVGSEYSISHQYKSNSRLRGLIMVVFNRKVFHTFIPVNI